MGRRSQGSKLEAVLLNGELKCHGRTGDKVIYEYTHTDSGMVTRQPCSTPFEFINFIVLSMRLM